MFGLHSGAEISSVVGCWTVSLSKWFLVIKAAQFPRMSGTVYLTTQCNIPEDHYLDTCCFCSVVITCVNLWWILCTL